VNGSFPIGLGIGLNVTLANGFTPTSGESFVILTASGGITGSFQGISVPATMTVQSTANSVKVIVP
jgi:hypothetical protein